MRAVVYGSCLQCRHIVAVGQLGDQKRPNGVVRQAICLVDSVIDETPQEQIVVDSGDDRQRRTDRHQPFMQVGNLCRAFQQRRETRCAIQHAQTRICPSYHLVRARVVPAERALFRGQPSPWAVGLLVIVADVSCWATDTLAADQIVDAFVG